MSNIVVVTAVGRDQPGIVAALAGAVYAVGGNLDDATMTRLHGVFATMLSVQLPAGKTVQEVRAALAPVGERLSLTVSADEVPSESAAEAPPDHLVTVYGADKPGIVYSITGRLAELGVNITDMDTRLAGSEASPVYVMLLEVVAGERDLAAELDQLRRALSVDIAVQCLDSEAL